MFRVSGEAEDHEDRSDADNDLARDSNVGISSMESSRKRREAKVAQSAFLAETSDIKEGPIGLYRKGLHDHVFRSVRDLSSLTHVRTMSPDLVACQSPPPISFDAALNVSQTLCQRG